MKTSRDEGVHSGDRRVRLGPQSWLLPGYLLEGNREPPSERDRPPVRAPAPDFLPAWAGAPDRPPAHAPTLVPVGDPAIVADVVEEIVAELCAITTRAPFRHMVTPGGRSMSVALTNCGALGWTSDRRGYRYTSCDPDTGETWPPMPGSFLRLAGTCASEAGFDGFEPDACLINRYEPGARLSLHQDRDEHDFGAPIVSVSLGLDAVFLFGGLERNDRPLRVGLRHGDVVVWGGVDRLRFHGVVPLKESAASLFEEPRHPLLRRHRINLTFRKAG